MSPQEPAVGSARGHRAALIGEGLMGGYAVAAALFANSVALRAHATHAALEVLVGLVTLVALRLRRRAAGREGGGGPGRGECGAVLLVSVAMGAVLVDSLRLSVEHWEQPPALAGTAPGLVALGLAGLSNLVFWGRYRELHALDGSRFARGRMRMHAHAVSVTLFAIVAVVAGTREAGLEAGGRAWLLRLDAVAAWLLAALMLSPLWGLGRRAARGVFGGR